VANYVAKKPSSVAENRPVTKRIFELPLPQNNIYNEGRRVISDYYPHHRLEPTRQHLRRGTGVALWCTIDQTTGDGTRSAISLLLSPKTIVRTKPKSLFISQTLLDGRFYPHTAGIINVDPFLAWTAGPPPSTAQVACELPLPKALPLFIRV